MDAREFGLVLASGKLSVAAGIQFPGVLDTFGGDIMSGLFYVPRLVSAQKRLLRSWLV